MTDDAHHAHRSLTSAGDQRRLRLVLVLNGGYLIAEVIGGWLTNSLALLSDAGHMLTDVAALALALFALAFAARPATPQKTYGYYRLEILAALLNGLTLLFISGVIIVEAIGRLQHPQQVHGLGLMLIAFGGLIVNLASALILRHHHAHSLNVRAAFYHMLGDTLGSLGAVLAGVLVYLFHLTIADPILAIVIALLIIVSAIGLVREAVDVLLEAVPSHIELDAVRAMLLRVPGVEGVHDLHIWTITSGLHSLTCHVVVQPEDFTIAKLDELRRLVHDHCDILHQTIQLETRELAAEEEIHG